MTSMRGADYVASFLAERGIRAVFLVPAILGYTFYSYWVFRGKISDETHYH